MRVEIQPTQYANLRALYHLENTTDSSGNGYTLTNNGTTAFNAGKFGNSGDLTSTNTSKGFTINNSLGIAGGACTQIIWLKLYTLVSTGDAAYVFMGVNDSTSKTYQYFYQYNSAGTRTLYFQRSNIGGTSGFVGYNTNLDTTNWHQLVYTYDGTNVKGYLDGGYLGSAAHSGSGTGSVITKSYIGLGYPEALAYYTKGKVDESAFYSSALTYQQINKLYSFQTGKYL